MKAQIEPDRDDLEIPKTQRRCCTMDLTKIAELHKDRKAAMRAAYKSGSYTLRQIAEYFGVHYSTVSRAINARCGIARPLVAACDTLTDR